MAQKQKIDFISTNDLTLEQFLEVIKLPASEKFYYPVGRFPTDDHLESFINTIHNRSEMEFRGILLHFIPKSCTYGMDLRYMKYYKDISINGFSVDDNILEEQASLSQRSITGTQYFSNLMAAKPQKNPVWEGLTWILDLLPHSPNEALKALSAYFSANCQFLPDDVLNAISDCGTMIRARYIDKLHPRQIFLDLSPIHFEKLVASLYKTMQYEISLTKQSYDGGIDIYAEKTVIASKEKLVIQCKNYTSTISVVEVRNLLGVVSHNKSTKGVLVTSSEYSPEAIKLANDNPSIELINHKDLSKLLNKHHGPYWIYKIENYIREI
jgi:restriction system protein